jgi:Fe2+ or Zn2+ uptake regulation protein
MKIFRMTNQREVILQEIGKCEGHPTADILYERIKKKLPRISLATVYRNLEILSEVGKIRKLEISGRQKRFDRELKEHSHICCIQCHRIDNIDINREQMPSDSAQKKGYKISGCRIEFLGICPECQKKDKEQEAPQKNVVAAQTTPKLSECQCKILAVLKKCTSSCTGKDIAARTSLASTQVSCQLTALKKKGLVISPARCQYKITQAGKNLIKKA